MAPPADPRARRLLALHAELDACRACPNMIGPVVHGGPVLSPVLIVGQAPGPREGGFGRPFAWTAGKTLFQWLEAATGAGEARVRERVHFSAVARCFPGKARGGGDRKPAPDEIARCGRFLAAEIDILRPKLVLPLGALAIAQALGEEKKLAEVVGRAYERRVHGVRCDVIPLPHPSGASTWHRTEPGKTLLAAALRLVAAHPAVHEALAPDAGAAPPGPPPGLSPG
ncbi:MAG TPA: uracil-DNA glycosylase family protein [Polyangiaceae bacterium]|nr:uracil-DNA glycosylase family protein [Polyangiaceae bacterium]